MKHLFFPMLCALTLLALPAVAKADANPDFDDDAAPILRMQPGLLEYVQARYEVKDTGMAKFPGDDDHAPRPPYIFRARPIGSHGPFNLRLLIQRGPPGHILGVVDITKVHLNPPGAPATPPSSVAAQPQPPAPSQPAPPPQNVGAQQPAQQSPTAASPPEPTADTPSGPIMGNSNSNSAPASLAPPPDPAPNTQ